MREKLAGMRVWLVATAIAASACTSSDPCATGEPGTVCRIAGTGAQGYNGDSLAATKTELYFPSQVRRGPDGLLYVMDSNNMRLRRIEADDTVSTVVGNGIHVGAADGEIATNSGLDYPVDFDWLPNGRLAFVQLHDPRIIGVNADGTLGVIAGGLPGSIGNEGDGGDPRLARFVEPAGFVVAPDGSMYIADRTANRIRVIKDGVINTLAGTGVPGYEGDGGPAKSAMLSQPTALALDAAGNLFVTDTGNCTVRRIAPDGTITTVAGSGYPGFGGDGGPANRALLAHPEGLALASDGTIYIGDRFNNRVRRIGPDGTISTIAGTGVKGVAGDGGPALDAELGSLSRVQLDTDGNLLISDQTNSIVRKLFVSEVR